MSDRDERYVEQLGELETNERHTLRLYLAEGLSTEEAIRLGHDIAVAVSSQFRKVPCQDAELGREFDSSAALGLYRHGVYSVGAAEREVAARQQAPKIQGAL